MTTYAMDKALSFRLLPSLRNHRKPDDQLLLEAVVTGKHIRK